jgi:predicted glycogen debranching enzyme
MNEFVWPSVRVDGELNRARVEWIHANGAGAFASSTVARLHTRRYHGLLVAAMDPPRRRHVVLSHVDATVTLNGTSTSLATHQFPGVQPSSGHKLLMRFAQDPLPRWVYSINGADFEHTLALARGHNAVILKYLWNGTEPMSLELRPLLALRPFHDLVREHGAMIQRVELRQNEVRVRPVHSLPRVAFRHTGIFVGSPDWWRRFEYLEEQARGMDFQEDLWTPGVFRLTLQPGTPAYLACAVDSVPERSSEELMQEAADSIRACDPGTSRPWSVRVLAVAADLFRADLAPCPGIIAGYPWFEIWGRHSLLAFSGLYLTTGRYEDGKRVLQALISNLRDGLLPNRLPDSGAPPEYHAIDATLLLFVAAQALAAKVGTSDPFVVDSLLPVLEKIFETLMAGTRDGIHITEDGLLAAGAEGTSLTWMDARIDEHPVTSRAGLAVEVQALFSKACATLGWLARENNMLALAERAELARDRVREAFAARFWCESTRYPYDTISEEKSGLRAWFDSAIRPNALLALALEPTLFEHWQAEAIVERVERDLLTSAGLRSLAPYQEGYRGMYAGGVRERDAAYHQGTSWPFLLASYAHAVRWTYPEDGARLVALRARLEGVLSNTLALGQVPEIADGEPPHRPNGCVAYATSVAELLRSLVEDLGL